MNWKEDLNKKAEELKIKEEINDGHVVSPVSIGNRNNSRSSSDVHRLSIHKEINNVKEKGGKVMITLEAIIADLDGIANGTYQGKKLITESDKLIAIVKVIMKFLSTMRSNQLLTEEEKVKIRTARKERDAKKVQK